MQRFAWVATLAMGVWYAPLAADYMLKYLAPEQYPHRLSLWERHFSALTNETYATAVGRQFTRSFAVADTTVFMGFHAIFGALTLLFMSLQFVTPLRKHYIQVHRACGYAAYGSQVLSLYGSAAHLQTHGTDMFSGAEFAVTLWVLWGLSTAAMMVSFLYIGNADWRDVRLHKGWSALNYATIASAPLLRVVWVAFFKLGVPGRHEDNNVAATNVVFVLLMLAVLLFFAFAAPAPPFDPRSVATSAVVKGCLLATDVFMWLGLPPLLHAVFGYGAPVFAGLLGQPAARELQLPPMPVARTALVGGFAGLLLLMPVFVRQQLARGGRVDWFVRAAVYAATATLAYGAKEYCERVLVPLAAPSLAWPSFAPVLVGTQAVLLALELALPAVTAPAAPGLRSGAAKTMVGLLAYANCAAPAWLFAVAAFVRAAWPGPYGSRVVALGAAASVQAVPLAVGLIAILYLPRLVAAPTASTAAAPAAAKKSQ